MSLVAFSLSLALAATEADAQLWAGPSTRTRWVATNQDGFCSLKRVEETAETKLEFMFVSGLHKKDVPKGISFQVSASPAKLAWPMTFSVGSDRSQPHIVLGADQHAPPWLGGTEAQQLLIYLKNGHGLDVAYALADGAKLSLYLDAFNFPQAVAMFEACTAHVA